MAASQRPVTKGSLRGILADSRVAAATIAMLLMWATAALFQALWFPVYRILEFVVTAILILDIPYHAPGVNVQEQLELIRSLPYLWSALVALVGAWLLSRWVYRMGLVRALTHVAADLRGGQLG